MNLDSKIFVAGHKGLVGSAILKQLKQKGYKNIITRSKDLLNLKDDAKVLEFFKKENIEYIFLAAAKVGGILANNTYRADFLYENLALQNSVINNAYLSGVKKLLFLGSSCIYPKNSPQPIKEEYLLTSSLEYTNEPYAIAKIAGLKLCESYSIQHGCNFISAMPTNLYGDNDNFNLLNSHVLPALIRKIYLAKLLSEDKKDIIEKNLQDMQDVKNYEDVLKNLGISKDKVEIWGSGSVRREFMHSSDMAKACIFIMESINFKDLVDSKEIKNTHINIGYGSDITIKELAYKIKEIIGFKGELFFNKDKPDGVARKLMDNTKLEKLGFKPSINLDEGIKDVFAKYKSLYED